MPNLDTEKSCELSHVTIVRHETFSVLYCGISTDCSANVTRDGLEQMGPVFEIGVTV